MSKSKSAASLPAASLIGGGGAMLMAICISFLLAWLGAKTVISQENLGQLIPMVIAVSVFLGTLLSLRNIPGNMAALSALGTAAVYCILCLTMKMIFFRGDMMHFLRNVLIALGGSAAAVLLQYMIGNRKKFYGRSRRR